MFSVVSLDLKMNMIHLTQIIFNVCVVYGQYNMVVQHRCTCEAKMNRYSYCLIPAENRDCIDSASLRMSEERCRLEEVAQ